MMTAFLTAWKTFTITGMKDGIKRILI